MVKAMVGGCCVCSDERGWDENPLVYCDGHGCDVAVHQACYGIVQVPKGPWFCRKCESQERIARVKCELCPSKVGALKRTDNGGWAHVVCALYVPEVRFGNVSTMEPIILASVPHDRYLRTCYICEERGKESKTAHGCCMNCNKLGCKQTFHVTCAQSCKLLCEENDGQSGPTVKYVGYCQYHWNKKTTVAHHLKYSTFNEGKGLPFIKTPEKEKPKLKTDKDVKKPKSRTSSESSTTSTSTPPVIKPDSASTPVSKSQENTPIAPSIGVSTTNKPRGRKPAVVKTPVTSSSSLSSAEISESPVLCQKTAMPSCTPPSVLAESKPVVTNDRETGSVVTPVVTPFSSGGHALSSTGSTTPITATCIPQMTPSNVSDVMPSSSITVKKSKPIMVPKKRSSGKTHDEPKRKVGRPPTKDKSPTKPRPSNKPSGGRPRVPAKVKSLLNTALPISSSSPLPSSSPYPSYSSGSAAAQSSPIPIQSGLVPHNTYVTPLPRHAAMQESGHQVTEQQNRQQNNNVPLQLPSSLEQLLEYQWEQGAQFLMQQASQYDVASLMSSLHQLKADNSRLEARLESLMARRSQLLQVNARLSAPMSCTPVSASTTPTDTTNKDMFKGKSAVVVQSSQSGCITSASSNLPVTMKDSSFTISRTVSSVAMVEPTVCSVSSDTSQRNQCDLSHGQDRVGTFTSSGKPKAEKKSPSAKAAVSVQSVTPMVSVQSVTPIITGATHPIASTSYPTHSGHSTSLTPAVRPDLQPSLSSDRHRVVVTAAPITVLPATQVKIATTHSGAVGLPKQQKQTAQLLPSKHTNSKQPLILPQQSPSSQSYNTSQLQQQQLQQQQFILLMQQQQQLQQHIQQEDHLRRKGTSSSRELQVPKDMGSSQAQSKGPSAVIPQQFMPTALGYPSGFVTFSEQLGLTTGQGLPKGTAVFSALPVMQIDNLSKVDYGSKSVTGNGGQGT